MRRSLALLDEIELAAGAGSKAVARAAKRLRQEIVERQRFQDREQGLAAWRARLDAMLVSAKQDKA